MNGSLSSTLHNVRQSALMSSFVEREILLNLETKPPIRILVEIDERANPEDDAG